MIERWEDTAPRAGVNVYAERDFMRRGLTVLGVMLVILGISLVAFSRLRPTPAQQQGDPAIAMAIGLAVLERNPEVALTPEQVRTMLPFLRVLRDIDPNDFDVSRALIERIRDLLTPEQRAAIARMREESQAQQRSGQFPPGSGSSRGSLGAGGQPAGRVELRRQVLSRLIERLQGQLSQS